MKPELQKEKDKKLLLKVLIENDRIVEDEFLSNQKLQVIVNRALEKLSITAEGRELKREDGTPLLDLSQTIGEVALYNNETLRFFKKAPNTPDRDKGFA